MFRRQVLALVTAVLSMAADAHAATHPKIPELTLAAYHWAAIAIVAVVIIVAPLLYLLPGIIAFRRHHHNAVAILVFDLCLGWTFLGWVLALVWALTAVRHRDELKMQRIEPDFR